MPATIAWGDFASRTIVNAIHDYDAPAQATIGSGAHSIAVTGVGVVNARLNEWFRAFNPAPGQLGEGA